MKLSDAIRKGDGMIGPGNGGCASLHVCDRGCALDAALVGVGLWGRIDILFGNHNWTGSRRVWPGLEAPIVYHGPVFGWPDWREEQLFVAVYTLNDVSQMERSAIADWLDEQEALGNCDLSMAPKYLKMMTTAPKTNHKPVPDTREVINALPISTDTVQEAPVEY